MIRTIAAVMMRETIAFCAGFGLAFTADAADFLECKGAYCTPPQTISTPADATKIAIDDLKARVKALEQITEELCAELAMPCPGKPQ